MGIVVVRPFVEKHFSYAYTRLERSLSRANKKTSSDMTRSHVLAPRVGLEPTTTRLTAEGSTIELPRNM